MATIREVVLRHLAATVERSSPVHFPNDLSDDARLDQFWIDSVAFASLIGSLGEELKFFPLTLLAGVYYPETFGGLVEIYEEAARERLEAS